MFAILANFTLTKNFVINHEIVFILYTTTAGTPIIADCKVAVPDDIMAAFAILFPNTEFYLYFAIPVKAKYLVGLYFVFCFSHMCRISCFVMLLLCFFFVVSATIFAWCWHHLAWFWHDVGMMGLTCTRKISIHVSEKRVRENREQFDCLQFYTLTISRFPKTYQNASWQWRR